MKFFLQAAGLALFGLVGFAPFANAACQVASDPDALVASIAEAGKKSGISTEVLRLMLPCPGSKAKAAGLVQLLNGNFTQDQIGILTASFAFQAPTLRDTVAMAQTRASKTLKEQILGSYSQIAITFADLRDVPRNELSSEQLKIVAGHIKLDVSEDDFIRGLHLPTNDGRAQLFRASLSPITLKSTGPVFELFRSANHAELAGRVTISDPMLWAFAVKNGARVADLTKFVSCKDREMSEVFRAFQAAEIPDVIAADLVTHNSENIHLRERDIGFVSMAVIPSALVDKMFLSLKHEAFSVDPVTIARLKAHGVSDEAILALGKDEHHALTAPAFVLQADSYGDPLAKISPLSGGSGSHGLGAGRGDGFGPGSGAETAGGTYRVGGEVSAPILVSKTEPEYSEEARRAGHSGRVLLSLVVGANGLPRDITVVRPLGMGLDEKAIEAIQKWRFTPGMKGGRFVATQATIEVSFSLGHPLSSDPAVQKANPVESGAYRVGGDVSAATVLTKVEPEYTDEARNAGYNGTALLSLVVDANGLPQDIKVVRPLGLGLDEKAVEAARKWRFQAGRKGGRPVATQATIEMSFRLVAPTRENLPNRDLHASKSKPPIWSKPKSENNLRVEIVQTQWSYSEYGTSGYGKGNVTDDGDVKGFHYTFSCFAPFLPSDGGSYYLAHWKKPGTRLVIQTSQVGNPNKHSSCELKVSLEPYTFRMQNGTLYTYNTH